MRNAKSDFWGFRESRFSLRLVVSAGKINPRQGFFEMHLTFSLGRFCIPQVADSFVEKPESGGKSTRRPALVESSDRTPGKKPLNCWCVFNK